ncbi:Hypothetical protein HVR_LOCUS494 [uncultured virus]|nr:Hypothetical protein HVR_LOCUS494 [uncultured virus]
MKYRLLTSSSEDTKLDCSKFTPEIISIFNRLKPLFSDLVVEQTLVEIYHQISAEPGFTGESSRYGPGHSYKEMMEDNYSPSDLKYIISFSSEKRICDQRSRLESNIIYGGEIYDKVLTTLGLYKYPGLRHYVRAINKRYNQSMTELEVLKHNLVDNYIIFNDERYNSEWCYLDEIYSSNNRLLSGETMDSYKYVPTGRYKYTVELNHNDFMKRVIN